MTTEADEIDAPLTLPGEWDLDGVTLPLVAPRLPEAIRWQIKVQALDDPDAIQEELPEITLAAAGLCCPKLPDRARREDWTAYADRVCEELIKLVPHLSPLTIYNRTHAVYIALRNWLLTGAMTADVQEVEEMGNS